MCVCVCGWECGVCCVLRVRALSTYVVSILLRISRCGTSFQLQMDAESSALCSDLRTIKSCAFFSLSSLFISVLFTICFRSTQFFQRWPHKYWQNTHIRSSFDLRDYSIWIQLHRFVSIAHKKINCKVKSTKCGSRVCVVRWLTKWKSFVWKRPFSQHVHTERQASAENNNEQNARTIEYTIFADTFVDEW